MLEIFLDAKPLYYDEIDYARFPRIYNRIKSHFQLPKIIHLVGTNGKGTTGRFLAMALHHLSYKVGHFTSPHISKFNERIWLDGQDSSDLLLEATHQRLLEILSIEDSEALSYFEYTTLLAMLVFEDCEFVVLEAGLGGEFDATAVFDKILTLVTPIDIDHEAFLGNTIEAIAKTKLKAIEHTAIIAEQKNLEVYDVAESLAQEGGLLIYKLDEILKKEDKKLLLEISKELDLPFYLEQNLALSIAALCWLEIAYTKESFKDSKLFGRLTRFRENILIDVGHNALAARSIVTQLRTDKYILIYNTYKDKDFREILRILKPIIKHVEIIDIDGQRVASLDSLHKVLIDLEVEYTKYNKINKSNNYLIFGSFSVAQSFLREYNE